MIETVVTIFVVMILALMALLLITGYVAVGYLVVLPADHIRHRNAKLETGKHARKG